MDMKVILFLYLMFAASCTSSNDPNNSNMNENISKQIENLLEDKYSEGFKVTESNFEKGLNAYTFTAHPSANPEIIFTGEYDERDADPKKKLSTDSYVNNSLSYEGTVYFESLFPNKELTHVAQTEIYSNMMHTWGNKVIDLSSFLENRPDGSTVLMNSYFFDIPDEPYHQIVVTIRAVLEELQMKYKNNYAFYTGFWPEGFLEDKEFSELTWGFNATTMDDADEVLNVFQYLAKVLFFKIVSGSIDTLDEEKLFQLIEPHNKQGQNEMHQF